MRSYVCVDCKQNHECSLQGRMRIRCKECDVKVRKVWSHNSYERRKVRLAEAKVSA